MKTIADVVLLCDLAILYALAVATETRLRRSVSLAPRCSQVLEADEGDMVRETVDSPVALTTVKISMT
jgi:hypothetical protein